MTTPDKINICVLGGGGVGKSSTCVQYVNKVFLDLYDPTIMETWLKIETVDGHNATLTIVDTSGQSDFADHRIPYIRCADSFVFMYSLVSEESLDELSVLMQQVVRVRCGLNESFPFVVVGNKRDLVGVAEEGPGRRLTRQLIAKLRLKDHEAPLEENDLPYMTCSARHWNDCEQIFRSLVRMNRVFRSHKYDDPLKHMCAAQRCPPQQQPEHVEEQRGHQEGDAAAPPQFPFSTQQLDKGQKKKEKLRCTML